MEDMKEATQSMFRRFHNAWQAWSQVPETAIGREQVWFTGLAVAPADFSSQLSKLQISLQREGTQSQVSSPALTR
jgi:hypothetical protein